MKLLKSKKGLGEQFNWIFVVVAGGIILAFLVTFTFRYIDLQNKKANVEVGRTIDNNFRLLETTEFSLPIDLGTENKVEFFCLGDDQTVRVNSDYEQKVKDTIIFAPEITRGKQLAAWIYNWEYPYLVSRFLYVSGLDNKYLFVGTTPDLVEDIPSLFNIEKVSGISEAEVEDSVKTKFIYFEDPTADLKTLKDKYSKSNIVYIDQENKKVTFYEGGEDKGDRDYFGDAFLYGAIFAGDKSSYECALDRAINKLKMVSKNYIYKTTYISNVDRRAECRYPLLKNYLDKFASGNLEKGDENKDLLDETNKNLYGEGCPAVF